MKPEDLEKIGKIHEHYKCVAKDCKDLYILSEKLSEKSDTSLHVCLNQANHAEIPSMKISNFNNIAETLIDVIKEAREGFSSAHIDLTNAESLEVVRLMLKLRTAQKASLADALKNLGVDII